METNFPRKRLQNDSGILGELPQSRIKLSPHFIGGMIRRPAQVQRQLGEGIEALDICN